MKDYKLNINTKSKKYPIYIGDKYFIINLTKFLKKIISKLKNV